MRLAAIAVLSALLVGALSLAPTWAIDGVEITLQIAGERPLLNGEGQPVWIAGLWHQLSLTLPSPLQSSLTLKASSPNSQRQDMSSYYLWERDEANGTWSDSLYGFFIRPEFSRSDGQQILLYIGIDAAAIPGPWRLEITQDGAPLGDQVLEVRAPQISYGLASADFIFRAEPFTAAELFSEDLRQYLRIANQGNVPFLLDVSFDRLQNRLSLVNPSDVAHIYDSTRYFLNLNLDPRPPQIIKVTGVSRVEITHLIPSPGSSQLVPAIEGEFSLKVVVGRSGYEVQALGNVIFQTLQSLRADYGSLVTWQVFLTGDQPVSLDVEVTGARLVGILQDATRLTLPATLTPTPDSELPITLQVMAHVPSTEAEVLFTLRLLDTGEVRTYRTTIAVGPKPPVVPSQVSYLWLVASLMTATVLALVSYNHLRLAATPRDPLSRVSRAARRGRRKKTDGKRKRKKAESARGKQSEGGGTPNVQGRSKAKGPP